MSQEAEAMNTHDISKMKKGKKGRKKVVEKLGTTEPVVVCLPEATITRLKAIKKSSGNSVSRIIAFAVQESFDRKIFDKLPDHEPSELRKARAILEKYKLKPIY